MSIKVSHRPKNRSLKNKLSYTASSRKEVLEECFLPFKKLEESEDKNMFSSRSGKYLRINELRRQLQYLHGTMVCGAEITDPGPRQAAYLAHHRTVQEFQLVSQQGDSHVHGTCPRE